MRSRATFISLVVADCVTLAKEVKGKGPLADWIAFARRRQEAAACLLFFVCLLIKRRRRATKRARAARAADVRRDRHSGRARD